MDNPYLPPETLVRTSTPAIEPARGLDRAASAFLTTVIALVGACVAQVASLVPILVSAGSGAPANIQHLLWPWFMASGFAVCCGLHGGYRALRRGSVGNFSLLAFLLLYSVTARFENVSFGWPFQLHAGMVFERIGVGLNLVGVGLIAWWAAIRGREAAQVGVPGMHSEGG